MSDYNLGTARGRIEVDTSGVSRNVGKAGKDVDGFTGKLAKSGGGMVKAGAVIGSVGVAIGAGFALAVNSAMDYEHRLSAIQAVSGASAAEMETLSKKALALGKDTKFSASEAATAIEELVKAGISVPDVMNGAADATVALAAAGEIALPEAATIAANAMNGFGLTAKEMPKIADAIAGAANASAIDVGQFGQSLQQVAAVANLAGLSFQDTAVAIAEMGNAGIKGSDAGTSLKSFLSNLIPTSKEQINLFEQLGFSAVGSQGAMDKLAKMGIKPVSKGYDDVRTAIAKYVEASGGAKVGTGENNKEVQKLGMATGALKNQFFDATGKAKSLKDMQALLAEKTKGMSKEQKLAAFNTLFGSDAIRAASIMAQNGSAGYDKMAGSMKKVTAAEVAATRQASLKGKLENLKGSAETIAITIGQQLIPVLKTLTENLTKALNWFLNLDEGTRNTILIIVGIIGAISLVVGGLIAFAGAIGMLLSALAPLATIIGITAGALMGWIAVIALIVAAVVILGVLIWKNWDKIKAWTISIWNSIKDWIINAWNTIYAKVSSIVGTVVEWIKARFEELKSFVVAVFSAIAGFFSAVWSGIVAAVTFYINAVLTVITTILNFIKGVWTAVWGLFGPLVMAVFGLIAALVQYGMSAIMLVINTVLGWILTAWNFVWGGIVTAASAVWTAISGVVSAGINFVLGIVRSVLNAVVSFFAARWATLKANTIAVWNAVVGAVSGPLNAIRARVSAIVGAVTGAISSAWNSVKTKTSEVWNGLTTSIGTAINNLMAKVGAIKDKVLAKFTGAKDWLLNIGKSIIQGLINGIQSMIKGVTDKLTFLTKLIPKKKGPASKDKILLEENGVLIMKSLINGIQSQVSPLEGMLKGITLDIPSMAAAPGAVRQPTQSGSGDLVAALQAMQTGSGALVGGDLILQATPGQSVESQFDSVMFRLRTTKGATR